MDAIRSISPIARAIAVIAAVAVLVTSVTFAALSDTATLTDNTITSATADLNIWDGSTWAGTATGFDLVDAIPGTWSAPIPFYMQNDSPFDMDVSVIIEELPALTNIDDPWDVKIRFHDETTAVLAETNLNQLKNGPIAIGSLATGVQGSTSVVQPGNYFITVQLDPTGVSGNQASVSGFDFQFTGTQVVPTP